MGRMGLEFQPALPWWTLQSSPEDASNRRENLCPRFRGSGDQAGECTGSLVGLCSCEVSDASSHSMAAETDPKRGQRPQRTVWPPDHPAFLVSESLCVFIAVLTYFFPGNFLFLLMIYCCFLNHKHNVHLL